MNLFLFLEAKCVNRDTAFLFFFVRALDISSLSYLLCHDHHRIGKYPCTVSHRTLHETTTVKEHIYDHKMEGISWLPVGSGIPQIKSRIVLTEPTRQGCQYWIRCVASSQPIIYFFKYKFVNEFLCLQIPYLIQHAKKKAWAFLFSTISIGLSYYPLYATNNNNN